jgi:pimeloyl-ACP methyl ester carboxylesterase
MQCRGYAWLLAVVTIATLTFFAEALTAQLPVAAGSISMVPVQGHAMRVRVARLADRQPGRPVVVLESGALQSIDTWGPIFNQVGVLAPVIAYDRRGIGRSEFDGEPPSLAHVNESLHALLAAVNAPPPYVLVGHSYGGVLIRSFARRYPTDVAGMVYLDVPDTDLTLADLAAVSPEAAGILRSELDGLPADLPAGMRAELDNIRRLMANDFTELNAVRPPAGIPVAAVVAAGKLDQVRDPIERSTREVILRIQIRHQQGWALSSPQGLFAVTQRGGHNVHHDNPDLAVSAIRHVLTTIATR